MVREIEKAVGRRMNTPRDFDWLSAKVFERTHERLSPTTLKRLSGYLDEGVSPRSFTLDVLSRFLGYRDYAAFLAGVGETEPQSNIVISERLSAADLSVGRELNLAWPPGRKCTVRHLGGCRFEVVKAENTKLCAGDTFSCSLFISHEPLYLDNLVRCGGKPVAYVAGRKDGITFELV